MVTCNKPESDPIHHAIFEVHGNVLPEDEHTDACNIDASYEGEELGYVATMDCHEYEGCHVAND